MIVFPRRTTRIDSAELGVSFRLPGCDHYFFRIRLRVLELSFTGASLVRRLPVGGRAGGGLACKDGVFAVSLAVELFGGLDHEVFGVGALVSEEFGGEVLSAAGLAVVGLRLALNCTCHLNN